MRYWHRPSFWVVLIAGEILAYLVAAYSTLLVAIILVGGLGVSQPRIAPWGLAFMLGWFGWLSYRVFRFARRHASKGIVEPPGFEVIVRQGEPHSN